MRRLIRSVFFLPAILFVGLAGADQAVPSLHRRATDLTGTLSASQQTDIENTLQAFEQKKGSQVAVLIVPTTQPEPIEQYAIRVASPAPTPQILLDKWPSIL